MANHMAEVAKMLGVELGEEFEVEKYSSRKHRITVNGFERYEDGEWLGNHAVDSFIFEKLLTGKYAIKRKPWKPNDGERYWYVDERGRIWSDYFDYYSCTSHCMNYYKLGNCYRTREEAEVNRDKWIKFYASDEVMEV